MTSATMKDIQEKNKEIKEIEILTGMKIFICRMSYSII